MKQIIVILLSIIAFSCPTLWARDVKDCRATSTGDLVFLADSIDFRSDLTRLYGRLSGRPHTAGRIDYITVNGDNKKPLMATDIDGVDFKRWFQWEDDGIIPLEIDFPPMKPAKMLIVLTYGPKGESKWQITVNNRRKNKR